MAKVKAKLKARGGKSVKTAVDGVPRKHWKNASLFGHQDDGDGRMNETDDSYGCYDC